MKREERDQQVKQTNALLEDVGNCLLDGIRNAWGTSGWAVSILRVFERHGWRYNPTLDQTCKTCGGKGHIEP